MPRPTSAARAAGEPAAPARQAAGQAPTDPAPAPLAREVLAGTAVEAAPRLLGCQLTLRIVEVEAYGATGDLPDPASHAHRGPTAANQAMFAVRPTARGGSGRRGIRP